MHFMDRSVWDMCMGEERMGKVWLIYNLDNPLGRIKLLETSGPCISSFRTGPAIADITGMYTCPV